MAALQLNVGGLPPAPDPKARSFAEALLDGRPPSATTHPSCPTQTSAIHTPIGTVGMHKGLPSIAFTASQTNDLSKPYAWALIGKFAKGYNKKNPKQGRPSVADLHSSFMAMDFRGSFQLGLLDNHHLLIQFCRADDYLRMYSRQVWSIRGISMRVFKWSLFYRVDRESSMVPIWVSMPRLPIHLFQRNPLFSIANLLELPLRMDDATAGLRRPSVARVQIELDVLKPRPDKIWIQMSEEGFWQTVDFENVPHYCRHCWHLGHSELQCRVHNPELRANRNKLSQMTPNATQEAPSQVPDVVPKNSAPQQPAATIDPQQQPENIPSQQQQQLESDVSGQLCTQSAMFNDVQDIPQSSEIAHAIDPPSQPGGNFSNLNTAHAGCNFVVPGNPTSVMLFLLLLSTLP